MEQSHVILIVIIAIIFILLYITFSEKKSDKKNNKYYCDGNVCKPLIDKNYNGKTYDDDVCGGDCNEEPEPEEVDIYVIMGNNSQISDTVNEDGSATVKLDSVGPNVIVTTVDKDGESTLKETISLDDFLSSEIWNNDVGAVVMIKQEDDENDIIYATQLVDKPLFSSGTLAFNCNPINEESMNVMSSLKGVLVGNTSIGFTVIPK